MPDTDLKKLDAVSYEKAKKDFLRKTSQAAREDRAARHAESRARQPQGAELSKLNNSEFEKAKAHCLRNLR